MRNNYEQRDVRTDAGLVWPSRIIGLTRVLGVILFLTLLYHPVQAAQSVTLAWNASPATNVAGYRMYYGAASGTYTNMVGAGSATSATAANLVEGATYYFAVTAYTTFGLESDYSNEAIYTVPTGIVRLLISAATGGQVILTLTGQSGRTYDILATQTFTAWTVIGAVTVGAGGSSVFTDTNTAGFPTRFYRAWARP